MSSLIYSTFETHGTRVVSCSPEGDKIQNERDAMEIIGEALQQRAGLVLIPSERFGADFFRLRTTVAGQIIQKFVTYRLRLAIVGDISPYLAQSTALRDFVIESNRGRRVWFLNSENELEERLNLNA
jgi:hypothetical protein